MTGDSLFWSFNDGGCVSHTIKSSNGVQNRCVFKGVVMIHVIIYEAPLEFIYLFFFFFFLQRLNRSSSDILTGYSSSLFLVEKAVSPIMVIVKQVLVKVSKVFFCKGDKI